MNAAVQRIIDLSKNLILMELMKLRSLLIDFEKSRVTVFDPERGELQFEVSSLLIMKTHYVWIREFGHNEIERF